MITLFQLPGAWGLPSISPFCVKVETYLRMTNTPYEAKVGDVWKGPKGKLPYIEDDGERIGDSGFILAHLGKKYAHSLDASLSDDDRATGHLVRRTLEEHVYWAGVYARWVEDDGFQATKAVLHTVMPPVVRLIVPHVLRRNVLAALRAQGISRHSADEVYSLARADLSAVARVLGDKPYLLGAMPSSFDASAFAFFLTLMDPPMPSPIRDHLLSLPNVVAYRDRMKAQYFAA